MGWIEFGAAMAVFLLSHVAPRRAGLRAWLTARWGERAYVSGYSLVSTGLLVWLIAAAGRAPYVALWDFGEAGRYAPVVLMLPALLLAVFAIGAPNPLSFGGSQNARFNPEAPGVVAVSRHPIAAAFGLWALGHVIANGDLAYVLLFGIFVVFAVAGSLGFDARRRRELGAEEWARLAKKTSLIPLGSLVTGRWFPTCPVLMQDRMANAGRVAIAVALYVLVYWLHAPVIGVAPLG